MTAAKWSACARAATARPTPEIPFCDFAVWGGLDLGSQWIHMGLKARQTL